MLSFGRSEFLAHFSFAWMTYLPISDLAAPLMTHFLFLLTWKCSYFSSFSRERVLLDVEFFSENFAPIICQTSRTLPDGLSTERFSFWERAFILIGVFSPPGLGVCCLLLAWRSSVRRSCVPVPFFYISDSVCPPWRYSPGLECATANVFSLHAFSLGNFKLTKISSVAVLLVQRLWEAFILVKMVETFCLSFAKEEVSLFFLFPFISDSPSEFQLLCFHFHLLFLSS